MKGYFRMEKAKYKATFLKTFLCFMIYKVMTVIITRITRYIQITLTVELVMSADESRAVFLNNMIRIVALIYIVLNFITIPLIRKLLIKAYPSLTVSATNAILYVSLTFLVGLFVLLNYPRSIYPNEIILERVSNIIMLLYNLLLYGYYKNKLKSNKVAESNDNEGVNTENTEQYLSDNAEGVDYDKQI